MNELKERHCIPCEGGITALDLASATRLRDKLQARWQLTDGGKVLEASFEFRDYWRTVPFVNAVAWIAHREDHHPDIQFGYRKCTIRWWTHAIDGLSENDFICAAKVDALIDDSPERP